MYDSATGLETEAAVRGLARREAAAHLLIAPWAWPRPAPVRVEVMRCPDCGATEQDVLAFPRALPLPRGGLVLGEEPPAWDGNTVTMLGCEVLTPRALLPAFATAHRDRPLAFRTRAVALARAQGDGSRSDAAVMSGILCVAHEEGSGAHLIGIPSGDAPPTGTNSPAPRTVVLPASTRRNPAAGHGGGDRWLSEPEFLSPHGLPDGLARYRLLYRQELVQVVRDAFHRAQRLPQG